MVRSTGTGRLRPVALALAVAAASIAVPAGASVADGEDGGGAASVKTTERAGASTVHRSMGMVGHRPMQEAPRFWTPERLAAAEPREPFDTALPDVDVTTLATELRAGSRTPTKVPRKRMPRSVGKLEMLVNSLPTFGECSAATIRDPKYPKQRSYVITAAHCLYDPKSKDWIDFAEFSPKYYGKKGSRWGAWDAKHFWVPDAWYKRGSWKHDIGVLQLQRVKGKRKSRQIVDVVGGNRLAYDAKRNQKRVRFIGYPAAGKYNGKYPYQCRGRAHGDRKRKWMTILPCAMTGGASGGPWFTRMYNKNTGLIYGTLSRGSSSGKRYITAAKFPLNLRKKIFKQHIRD